MMKILVLIYFIIVPFTIANEYILDGKWKVECESSEHNWVTFDIKTHEVILRSKNGFNKVYIRMIDLNMTDFNGDYVFDELGLKSWEGTENGSTNKLLTHVIFHPVQKSLNRLIQIDYTLRVQSLTTFTETSSTALSTSNTVSGTTSGGNTGY